MLTRRELYAYAGLGVVLGCMIAGLAMCAVAYLDPATPPPPTYAVVVMVAVVAFYAVMIWRETEYLIDLSRRRSLRATQRPIDRMIDELFPRRN
jgi:hypothetical protein